VGLRCPGCYGGGGEADEGGAEGGFARRHFGSGWCAGAFSKGGVCLVKC
jgi:hypothetical protein